MEELPPEAAFELISRKFTMLLGLSMTKCYFNFILLQLYLWIDTDKLEFSFLEWTQYWMVSQLLWYIELEADAVLSAFAHLFLKHKIVHIVVHTF